ncbi:MAG: hypothetical protein IH945_05490 [Armatimonadetes bacterium]|nr:hypothetical protein [Armatimonadota bacterium]
MPTYLGLDCGGSKTRAMVCDEGGAVVFERSSGPANLATTPRELIQAHLNEALDGAPEVDAACICIAGLLTPEDGALARSMLEQAVRAGRIEARPDTHGSWAATEGCADALVVAGTGAVVCSETDGRINKSGGGGLLFGDEGSATSVGRRALYHTVVSAERLPASDEFWAAVVEQFGSREPLEIVGFLYRSETPAPLMAQLAGTVAADAANGMEYAALSVSVAMNLLAEETLAHLDRYKPGLDGPTVCLSGGLWESHGSFEAEFSTALSGGDREISLCRLKVPPVYGACLLAKKIEI